MANSEIIGAGQDTARPAPKKILDACCGGRWMWFDKRNKNTLYVDCRIAEKGHDKYRPNHCVKPDVVMDFRELHFPDETFSLVVFDPPHMATLGDTSKFRRYYGRLDRVTWRDDLKRGFSECYRVLKKDGVLIFKWNETEIKLKELFDLFPIVPLFGHPTNSKNTTHWVCFMKLEESPVLGEESPAQNTMEICHTAPNSASMQNAQVELDLV
jgi:ubiquinone/menaquinone biosynthesis C-methylase UbiE